MKEQLNLKNLKLIVIFFLIYNLNYLKDRYSGVDFTIRFKQRILTSNEKKEIINAIAFILSLPFSK